MTRRLFTAILVLVGILGLTACPAVGGDDAKSKPAQKLQASVKLKPYELLRTKSDSHEMGDAYMLAYASCYIFPELLGVDRNDHERFTKKFADKVIPLGVKRVKYVSDGKTSTEVVIMTTDAAVIVVFRGSEIGDTSAMIKDWLTNLNAGLYHVSRLGKNVKVHRGMWKALDTVHEDVVKEVTDQGGFTKKRVYVTGHSLGGGLALLCGVRMHAEGTGTPTVYTFGAPRVGNFEFRKAAGDVPVHRWVNNKDVVPMMPSDRVLAYRHVGLTHNIKPKNEVYLDDSEIRAVKGSALDHHVYRYLEGLYANLPEDLKDKLPEPPG